MSQLDGPGAAIPEMAARNYTNLPLVVKSTLFDLSYIMMP
jgi:hypothetical protein